MHLFIYDKSFEGLLSAIFDAYSLKALPLTLCGPEDLRAAGARRVETSPEKSRRVFSALQQRLSAQGLNNLLLAWLAEEADGEALLVRAICKALEAKGQRTADNPGDPDFLSLERLARRLRRQTERYAGFARFQKSVHGVYCALIAPEGNVLPLLRGHFAGRFGDQPWLLYDVRRHYGVLRQAGAFREVFLDEACIQDGGLRPELLAEEEKGWQELWRAYHAAAAISERWNPLLQAKLMPKKFWKYITEKNDNLSYDSSL